MTKKVKVRTGEIDAQYESIFGDVAENIEAARRSAARSVNSIMTAAYWLIGRRVVEFEQSGKKRAEYGTALIERLSNDLRSRFGRGFGAVNLSQMKKFYLLWPPDKILQTLSEKSSSLPDEKTLAAEIRRTQEVLRKREALSLTPTDKTRKKKVVGKKQNVKEIGGK